MLRLSPYPGTAATPVREVTATVERIADGVRVVYRLAGDLGEVAWPVSDGESRRRNGLWRSTCLEMFARAGEGPGYVEFNLSPAFDWAVYRFSGVRQGMSEAGGPPSTTRSFDDRSERIVEVGWSFEALPELRTQPLHIGLSAVIEARDGSISYWALAHPSDKPDFHHPESFVLTLPEPA